MGDMWDAVSQESQPLSFSRPICDQAQSNTDDRRWEQKDLVTSLSSFLSPFEWGVSEAKPGHVGWGVCSGKRDPQETEPTPYWSSAGLGTGAYSQYGVGGGRGVSDFPGLSGACWLPAKPSHSFHSKHGHPWP